MIGRGEIGLYIFGNARRGITNYSCNHFSELYHLACFYRKKMSVLTGGLILHSIPLSFVTFYLKTYFGQVPRGMVRLTSGVTKNSSGSYSLVPTKTSGSSLLTTDYKPSIHENREAVSQRSKDLNLNSTRREERLKSLDTKKAQYDLIK